MYKGSSSYGVP
ncbi:hypothetical protein F383_25548 [Gossypium arboreum]|uniref:Uncharacterized protein n=1 Tax=Gossypium arboreum TaxID=29729 RepID=A0A0B0P591_GOSAR|nr:hypothetical protein F383_25548 [Gossypium arboreum]